MARSVTLRTNNVRSCPDCLKFGPQYSACPYCSETPEERRERLEAELEDNIEAYLEFLGDLEPPPSPIITF